MDGEKSVHSCVDCGSVSCAKRDGKFPSFCLTTHLDAAERDQVTQRYQDDPTVRKLAVCSAEVEGAFYNQMTRVEEIMEVARRIGAHKLGIASCVGLREESKIFARILRAHGFEVYGIFCKVGSVSKTDIGVGEAYTERSGKVMCNPLLQAELLNREKTDLNVVVGLCVGHDSLFYRNSDAYCTTLITKDRVLGHNPAAALYCSHSYYDKLTKEG